MSTLQKLLSQSLRNLADKLDAGNTNVSDEELVALLGTMEQFDDSMMMPKEDACTFLKISRSTFDDNVRCGLIPRGKKRRGFKELSWMKKDLIKFREERFK